MLHAACRLNAQIDRLSKSACIVFKRDVSCQTRCWSANTLILSKNTRHAYNIGLQKGGYRLVVRSGSGTKVKLSFVKNSYFEIEPNNMKTTATQLTLGKQYAGVFGDTESDYVNMAEDYYKVKLKKGQKYTVQFTQYKKLFAGDSPMAGLIVENPSGVRLVNADSNYALNMTTLPKSGKVTFTANKAGWYRIVLKPSYFGYKPVMYKIRVK